MRHVVFVGPDKTGSTWLQRYAEAHPQIRSCRSKELFHFLRPDGERDLQWYLRRFEELRPEHRVAFEVCHEYLFSPAAAEAIATDLPGATVLVGVRHPVDRAYSSYRYMLRQGRTDLAFPDAVRQIDELVDHSRLATHVAPFLTHLGPDRVRLLDFDLLGADPQRYADEVSASLGLPASPLPDALRDKVLPAATARSARLVRTLRATAAGLRRVGLYGLVETGKRHLAESPLLFRAAPPAPDGRAAGIDPETATWIMARLAPEIAVLDSRFGTDFGRRWGTSSALGIVAAGS